MHEIIELRRKIHKNPELGFREFETAKLVADYLRNLGIDVTENVAQTGVVGLIDNGAERTLLLRADMDALPICEENDVPYKSENPGVMHACGHDAHTAILLGAARELMSRRDELSCNVKFVFQPAEEGVGGALPMIEQGVMENPRVDAALALHVWPHFEVGNVILKKGSIMASPDNFKITVVGKGGHAASPDTFVNPISMGAEIVTALGKIKADEQFVVTVTKFDAGNFCNIVPDTTQISGTFRTLTKKTREWLANEIEAVSKAINPECNVEIEFFYPPLINDPTIINAVEKIAQRIIYLETPSMGGEDFAYFAERVPAAMVFIGCTNSAKGIQSGLHTTTFDIDEDCISTGVKLFTEFALGY